MIGWDANRNWIDATGRIWTTAALGGRFRLNNVRTALGEPMPRVFEALPVRNTFHKLGWSGIVAHGTHECRFFVDNVTLWIEARDGKPTP